MACVKSACRLVAAQVAVCRAPVQQHRRPVRLDRQLPCRVLDGDVVLPTIERNTHELVESDHLVRIQFKDAQAVRLCPVVVFDGGESQTANEIGIPSLSIRRAGAESP